MLRSVNIQTEDLYYAGQYFQDSFIYSSRYSNRQVIFARCASIQIFQVVSSQTQLVTMLTIRNSGRWQNQSKKRRRGGKLPRSMPTCGAALGTVILLLPAETPECNSSAEIASGILPGHSTGSRRQSNSTAGRGLRPPGASRGTEPSPASAEGVPPSHSRRGPSCQSRSRSEDRGTRDEGDSKMCQPLAFNRVWAGAPSSAPNDSSMQFTVAR